MKAWEVVGDYEAIQSAENLPDDKFSAAHIDIFELIDAAQKEQIDLDNQEEAAMTDEEDSRNYIEGHAALDEYRRSHPELEEELSLGWQELVLLLRLSQKE